MRKKKSTQQLVGIESVTDSSVLTAGGELTFYLVQPTNLNVLPESGVRTRVQRGHKTMSYFGSIYADQDLSHRARAVYMYLKDRSNTGDTCWPSVRRIAEDLKLSRRTVQRALSDLERHGFLERTHRRRPNGSLTSNLYRVK